MCKSIFLCIFAKKITLNINNKYLEYWIEKTSSVEINPSKNGQSKDSESYNYTFNYRVITYSL